MLNHVVEQGRICNDIELRRTGSGTPVVSFTLAVERDFSKDKETDFFDVVCWKNTAEFVSKFMGKGRMVVVSGRLQTRSWTDKDGHKRKTVEIVAESVYFGDSKKDSGNYTGFVPNESVPNNWSKIEDEDAQLPF